MQFKVTWMDTICEIPVAEAMAFQEQSHASLERNYAVSVLLGMLHQSRELTQAA